MTRAGIGHCQGKRCREHAALLLAQADVRKTLAVWQSNGLPARIIDAAEVRSSAPCLTDRVVGGVHTQRGGHANPQRTAQAFDWACGGEIREQVAVLAVDEQGGRITGLRHAAPSHFFGLATVISSAIEIRLISTTT